MEDRDDYPIIPQPLDDKQRIEKAAIKYVIEATGYQVLPEHEHWKHAFVSGATSENLHSNRLYDKMIDQVSVSIQKRIEQELSAYKEELASLKEENAKLKFRADLVSIYKQEKEDRDKILHQIKCTLYDRLTETEKLNDILKFFPTAIKPFSDNK